jgi:hypothetical protein
MAGDQTTGNASDGLSVLWILFIMDIDFLQYYTIGQWGEANFKELIQFIE